MNRAMILLQGYKFVLLAIATHRYFLTRTVSSKTPTLKMEPYRVRIPSPDLFSNNEVIEAEKLPVWP